MGLFGLGKKKEKEGSSKDSKEEKPKQEKINVAEKIDDGYLFCRIIIEILGIPKKHVEETLHKYVDQIAEDKRYEVVKKEFSETKEQGDEKHGKLFGLFVEIEMLSVNANALIEFCFDYMPSSIEILEPEKQTLNANELSGLFNDLQARLHAMDKTVKELRIENKNLNVNVSALLRNFIMSVINENSKTLKEISEKVGIPEDQLNKFIDQQMKAGFIEEKNKKYSVKKKG